MNYANFDPKTHMLAGVSNKPGTSLSGTTANNGEWVDLGLASVGAKVSASCLCGAVTGSPTSFTATFKIQEADSSGGAGAQDCEVKTDLVLSTSSTQGFATALRTKRYCRVVATPAFSGGAGPTLPVASNVMAIKHAAPA